MNPEPGQLWEYTDDRTGWTFLLWLFRHRTLAGYLTENFDAFVVDWDESYELDRDRVMVVGLWELRTFYKRVT